MAPHIKLTTESVLHYKDSVLIACIRFKIPSSFLQQSVSLRSHAIKEAERSYLHLLLQYRTVHNLTGQEILYIRFGDSRGSVCKNGK